MHAVREGRIHASGAELFVRRVGGGALGGSVLVAVGGGLGLSHELLRGLESIASASLEVVNYDPRGVGRSSVGFATARALDVAIDDLDAVRTALGSKRMHVLGHFWGGLVAALYAARYPDRTTSLTLVDCAPPTDAELARAMMRKSNRLIEYQRRGLVPVDLPNLEDNPAERLLAEWPIYFADPRHLGARTLGGAGFRPEAASVMLASLGSFDFRRELARIAAPTLHVATAVPFGYAMADAVALAMSAAPSRRIMLTTAGHLPFVEDPLPLLAEVADFLADRRFS